MNNPKLGSFGSINCSNVMPSRSVGKEAIPATMSGNKKISLKLLVDKKHSRVVFAESDQDFVDILLSFLTMPMGTICRLFGKDSSIGCITNLYESIQNLDVGNFQTDSCKIMLLRPLNAEDQHCENLVINIDDSRPRRFFTCDKSGCLSKATCSYSSVPNVKCSCGKEMSFDGQWKKIVTNDPVNGVFVKGGVKYVITDNLHIMLASTTVLLSLFGKLAENDGSVLEERILDVGHKEILNLLWRTLTSMIPLTNLCFNTSATNYSPDSSHLNGTFQLIPKSEHDGDAECKEVKVKLLLTKNDQKVVHMEGGEEMVDLVSSFLTSPLGSLVKLLNKNSSMGCVDNLYSSVENLCMQGNDCIKSEQCKMMLLHPKLAPFFSCTNQILMTDEKTPTMHSVSGCYSCFRSNSPCWATGCSHDVKSAKFVELNPKLPNKGTEPGGGYGKGPGKFILTDDFCLSSMSPVSTFNIVNKLGVPIADLVEKEVSIREAQALNLLKAALVSKTALSDVFASVNDKRRVGTV